MASSGPPTIGSCRLMVLRITGSPVSFAYSSMTRSQARVGGPIDALDSARAVHVSSRRNQMSLVGADLRSDRHERIRADRSRRTPTCVPPALRARTGGTACGASPANWIGSLHRCVSRVGQDGAVTERPSSHLEAALKPTFDLAVGQVLRHLREQITLAHPLILQADACSARSSISDVAVTAAIERMQSSSKRRGWPKV